MDLRPLALITLLACSSGQGKVLAKDAAIQPRPDGPLDGARDAAVGSGSATRKPTTGDVRVRVEWANVPVVARASPGKTSCGTPRAPSVMPTTTWGVPDAVVVIEGPPTGEARVVLAHCAPSPRAVLGASLLIASAMERPARLALVKRGRIAALESIDQATADPKISVMLPVAGHAVTMALEAGAVYELATDDPGDPKPPESAWIVAGQGAITDASGTALVQGLAPGTHAITAWLPPRAGQPGRVARGKVSVTVGGLADATLDLSAGRSK